MISGKSELCIFDKPLPQAVVEDAVFSDIHPSTAIDNSGSIDFHIKGSQNEYLDLNDSLLCVTVKAVANKGGPLPKEAPITPSNYFLNSLFSDVTLYLNDTVIEGGGSSIYPYKSTIETIFNYSTDTKNIQLLPAGYHEDPTVRKSWIAESKDYEMAGSLRLDFFNQPKYLIPEIDVRIKLQQAKPAFSLCVDSGASTPQLQIKNAVLYVRRVKVNPSVLLGHQLGLLKDNAHYPYTKSQLISYALPKGSLSYFKDNIFSSANLPKFVVVGLVKAKAYSGGYGVEPFNFEHFNVSSLGLFRNGQALPYREIYSPNFKDNLFTRDYVMSIIQGTEQLDRNINNAITMDMFSKGGYSLFTFNLTPDFCMTQAQMPRDGNLRLDMKFDVALPDSINVIVYGIFDAEIQITKDREIIQ